MITQIIYDKIQVADPNHEAVHDVVSPSATKPTKLAKRLKTEYPDIEFIQPDRLDKNDFLLCHSKDFVEGVLNKTIPNGFGTFSDSINESLHYTSGAMYKAVRLAKVDRPAAALVSGFHHAGYKGYKKFGYFCTFNGLVISALKLIESGFARRVAILDCDQHYGNGTADILEKLGRTDIINISFGKWFDSQNKKDSIPYLKLLEPNSGDIREILELFKTDIIIYQAGADVHIDDPFGGVLTNAEIAERDRRIFSIAKDMKIPIAWCLAGGYQSDIEKVLDIHINTFHVAEKVYGN